MPGRQGKENEGGARIKRFMCMMDSMTTKELDSPNPKIWTEPSRIMRIARGSGRHPQEVVELIGARTAMHLTAWYGAGCVSVLPMGSSAPNHSMCGLLVGMPRAAALGLWALHLTAYLTASRVSLRMSCPPAGRVSRLQCAAHADILAIRVGSV